MPIGAAFNDPNKMAMMALGARILQASQRGADPRTQGIGGVMGGFMDDLSSIQRGAYDSARQKREDERADKKEAREDKKYEQKQARQDKLREALKTNGHANGDSKKPGGMPDYRALATSIMDTDPDLALRLLKQVPKPPEPLRGKERYMVTREGLLDMRGDTPKLVPGLENIRSTGASSAVIQQTEAAWQHMKALQPRRDPHELWMDAYGTATNKSGASPQQAAQSFYADTLKKMISHEMSPEEVQAAAKTVGGLTDQFKKKYGPQKTSLGGRGRPAGGMGGAMGGGIGGGMGAPGPGPGGMGGGMGAPGPGPGGMGGGATPGPTPVAGMGAPIPRAAPVPDPGYRPAFAERGVSTPPPTPRPAPIDPPPGPGRLPTYAARGGFGGAAPARASEGAPAAPVAPTGDAEAYYNYLKEKYPNRSDEVIRARVKERFGV